MKPGEPGADRSRGPETSGATTPTRRAGHLGPGAGHPPGGRLPLPRGRRRRGRAGSRQQPGPLPGGPRGGQVDWLQADRGASECVWGSVCAGCSRWKPCLHVSAGRLPCLLVLLLPGSRRSGAAGSSGLTGRPRRSSAGASFSRPLRAAPHARLPHSAPGLPPASRRGSRACGAAPPKVSGPEPAARTTAGRPNPTPQPLASPRASRPGPRCQVQPRGTGEGLGFTAGFTRVDCLLPLEGGSGARSREEGQPLVRLALRRPRGMNGTRSWLRGCPPTPSPSRSGKAISLVRWGLAEPAIPGTQRNQVFAQG